MALLVPAACSGQDTGAGAPGARGFTTAPTPESPAPSPSESTPTGDAAAGPGSFPSEPSLLDDFARPGSGWARPGYDDGKYAVSARKGPTLAPAPRAARPGNRGVLMATEITLRSTETEAGLYCRASADGRDGYALTLTPEARWTMTRHENGRSRVLGSGRLPNTVMNDRGALDLLRLLCGTGKAAGPVSLAFAVNTSDFMVVQDPNGLGFGRTSEAGFFVASGDALYDNFALWLASAGG